MKSILNHLKRTLLASGLAWVLYGASSELYQIAWGTGKWFGEFSRTWAVLYYAFVFLCVFFLVFFSFYIWKREIFKKYIDRFVALRRNLGNFRWILWLVVFIVPVWLFQFTAWGIVLQKFYIRILVWIIVVCLLAILASNDDHLASWRQVLSTLILTASLFSIAAALNLVNDYPFSQGWSEGNRLWDYSVLFGRNRYNYPLDKSIPVYLDFGRQFIGGLPFLIPGITISVARIWVGLTQVIPYFLLGFALFRIASRDKLSWFLLTLWTFLFLKQGPIHPPLVICAAMVALAWRSRLWVAIPLVVGAGYFAQASRFTWIYAPGIWIFMLEIASVSFSDRKPVAPVLKRAILLAVLGIFGGVFLSGVVSKSQTLIQQVLHPVEVSAPVLSPTPPVIQEAAPAPVAANSPETSYPAIVKFVIDKLTFQPLLWYRLLPNSTYGTGILFALLLAVGPLVVILFYLIENNIWRINRLQKLSLLLPLLAFLVVGLVVSTKIGGGGDLHNMDMFLISLLFMGAIAWDNGASDWLLNGLVVPALIKGLIVLSLVNSAVWQLQEIRSFDFAKDANWIKTLVDVPSERDLDMLPLQEDVDTALQTIQEEVDVAQLRGEVLFMDQRQLLTFGNISGVILVPDYEKKWMMDEALSEKMSYFEPFYADLAAHRFSLIVSEPLHTPVKDSSYQFGEENNAWVKWVSNPVLCYYEEIKTLKDVGVQLLAPRSESEDCSAQLPKGN
jgi:hypothetical protein